MRKQFDFFLLLFLAKKTGLFNPLKTSTGEIALEFQVSQQTVSRKLRELKQKGLISFVSSPQGCEISLSEKGIAEIKKHFSELKTFFESGKKTRELEGKVSFGFGEGRYYISRKQYLEQFRELLGFKPYFGTLNLSVEERALSSFLLNSKPVFIQGFSTKERSFGSLKAFRISIHGVQGAIIIPERTKHPKNMIEIIAPFFLRKKFSLKENRIVKIRIAE